MKSKSVASTVSSLTVPMCQKYGKVKRTVFIVGNGCFVRKQTVASLVKVRSVHTTKQENSMLFAVGIRRSKLLTGLSRCIGPTTSEVE